MTVQESVTGWLLSWREGDDSALERVTELVYRDLKRLAWHYLDHEHTGHTLQPTALVHEAYLQISSVRGFEWQARAQFISVVARMMRRILIDHARRRNSAKRDAAQIGELPASATNSHVFDVLQVDQALERLSARYPRHAQIVQLRFFGGLEVKEVAELLEISSATVERDWRFARAYLQKQMAAES